ncbi:MAG TPA: DUF4383 domain-containing protein [Xanthobacteraceae bacterium]|nr:DUF4383 domain-containing protein [Xanthobacteraceae bacterium]
MQSRFNNPRVTELLLAVTGIEVLVLLGAGGGLLLVPADMAAIWPWKLTPFNAGFLGAIYLASAAPTISLVLIGRWAPARVVVPMIFLFSAVVLAVSLVYLDRFIPGNPSTWLWFLLYVGIPLNAAWHIRLYRDLPPAGPPWPAPQRAALLAFQAALALYGLALLAAPGAATAFWPWPIDAFHGRVYSVVFLTPSIGLWLLARAGDRAETAAMAATLLVGGVLAIAALAAVDLRAYRIVWSAPGTLLWLAIFGAIACAGVLLLARLRSLPRPAGASTEAGLYISPRWAAFGIGVAFVAAGLGGFMPHLMHPAPASAPPLLVPAAHGYLLGFFPVNAVHSIFHFSVGVLGLAAFVWSGWALTYVRTFAVVLAALTVMGLVPGLNSLFGLAPIYGHDVWLHGVEAAAAGYVGFLMPGRPAIAAAHAFG